MELNYKEKRYELMECVEPGGNTTFGFITIFKVVKKNNFETYKFVDYFCYSDLNEIEQIAKERLDLMGE